jgi:hypothetical protein
MFTVRWQSYNYILFHNCNLTHPHYPYSSIFIYYNFQEEFLFVWWKIALRIWYWVKNQAHLEEEHSCNPNKSSTSTFGNVLTSLRSVCFLQMIDKIICFLAMSYFDISQKFGLVSFKERLFTFIRLCNRYRGLAPGQTI